jgi:hypothetical protein
VNDRYLVKQAKTEFDAYLKTSIKNKPEKAHRRALLFGFLCRFRQVSADARNLERAHPDHSCYACFAEAKEKKDKKDGDEANEIKLVHSKDGQCERPQHLYGCCYPWIFFLINAFSGTANPVDHFDAELVWQKRSTFKQGLLAVADANK